MAKKKAGFTERLLQWHMGENDRDMPWKGEKNPYRIWLSEVILQQTRVGQGWAYYEKFIAAFPTVNDLANAPEQTVFKLWEGLGYYSRCRNLIATAKKIAEDYHGNFPSTYEEILSLKGIGPYTAAAIASFAFQLPHAVVDGNVTRVLSRFYAETTPIDSTAGKKLYASLAQELLDTTQPGIYNQAIMDFGATVCTPRNPLCDACPQQRDCQAYQKDLTAQLPVKEKSIVRKNRWFYFFIIETPDDKTYIRLRSKKDIWEGLYEFPCRETDSPLFAEDITSKEFTGPLLGQGPLTVKHISRIYRQELSHQTIQGQFITMQVKKPLTPLKDYILVDKQRLKEYPFPKFINSWLQDPSPAQTLF